MPSFEYEAQPPINPFINFWAGQRAADAHEAAQNTNQLASQTLGSNTQISANLAQSTGLANQLATQKNPLEIIQLRQQLGIDPSPTLDRLRDTFNGGGGQPSAPPASPDGSAGGDVSGGNPLLGPLLGFDRAGLPLNGPAPTKADANQPPGQNHPAQPVVQALAAHIMAAPPDQRPALYAQLRPAAIAAGATAPEQYPGDDVIGHLAGGGWGHPSATAAAPGPVQVAGPGAPTDAVPGPDPTQAPPGYLPGLAAQAVPQAPPQQGVDDVMARLRAAQPAIPNQNDMFSVGAPDGVVPAAPLNGMAGPQARPQLMPAASAQPPAPPPAPVPVAQTGMNAPQVQAAQDLIRRATQIEMLAAQTPNDPRVKATAAAMAADLRGRAAIMMQADSVTVGTNGVQTHALTGKQDSAAVPAMNYQPDPNNPGVLVSPGQKPVVLPPGRASTLPDGSTWITGPGGTFKEGRGPNLEGASAAATAAAGGAAAAASAAKTKDALIPLARTSVQAISNIDYGLHQLDEAAKGGIPTGYFAPALATAAAAAKSLGLKIPGVDPAAVSNIQTASKTLAVVSGAILQNILGPNAEITEGKIEAFIHAQPGIVNDPLATHRILNWARSQFTYDHEMAMDGLAHVDPSSGQLSPGWQAGYITKHGSGPIYDPVSGEMKQPDGQAPSREPPVEVKPASRPPLSSFQR